MSDLVLMKSLEELKPLGKVYAFDPRRQYLVLIENDPGPARMDALCKGIAANGLNIMFITGVQSEKWKVFELNHQVLEHKQTD
jgi:hypothetical protein